MHESTNGLKTLLQSMCPQSDFYARTLRMYYRPWTDKQMQMYQDRVLGIDIRFHQLMQRKSNGNSSRSKECTVNNHIR